MTIVKRRTPKRVSFRIDKLKCKKQVIKMIVEGKTLREIEAAIKVMGENCSSSSVNRYINLKFIRAEVFTDDSIELRERQGPFIKVTKYAPGEDNFNVIQSYLSIE